MRPLIIQAGMGIGVSNWALARAIAMRGQIGVVSGTAIDNVLVRRLQDGDPDGEIRWAMAQYPDQDYVAEVLKKFFIEGGRPPRQRYIPIPMITANPTPFLQKLLMLSNYVEVMLAKRGHHGEIGINFLEKIQMPILPSLYGAMLAGVDYVLMGAGIPREVPGVIDRLSRHEDVDYRLAVVGATSEDNFKLRFSPKTVLTMTEPIKKPKFYAVIASNTLALSLARKTHPPVDGFIIEAPTAGGHNAPPRGAPTFNSRGEPVYGDKDIVDFAGIAKIGLPFYLAGSQGSAEGLQFALDVGASGIQVGTAFALCKESGLSEKLKRQIIDMVLGDTVDIYTDPVASPTGFPFKVARLPGTNSNEQQYLDRIRRCDLGYLRQVYKKEDGKLGYRCSSAPIDGYLKSGGTLEETVGRKCLCNGLMTNIGLGQVWEDGDERELVTLGDDVKNIKQFIKLGLRTYSADDVLDKILQFELRKHGEPLNIPISHP